MNYLNKTALYLAMALLFVGCTSSSDDMDTGTTAQHEATSDADAAGAAADAVTAAPDVYTVLHEDDQVRILNMNLPAGATDGRHAHPDEAAYFVTGGTVRIHLDNGESVEMDIPDGAPLSHEAWTHSVENIGTKDLHAIVFEIQDGARDNAGVVPEGMGAADVAPDVYSVLAEDDRVRIIEMRLAPGATDGEHVHPYEAVYFLSGGKVRISLPEGDPIEAELPDGAVLTNEMWQHTLENIGDTEIHAVIVEFVQPVE